jgi:hypothetical protein
MKMKDSSPGTTIGFGTAGLFLLAFSLTISTGCNSTEEKSASRPSASTQVSSAAAYSSGAGGIVPNVSSG